MNDRIFSVSEINSLIKGEFDANILFSKIAISGELSNYKIYPSGHHYFSVKDSYSQLKCVMYKSNASGLRFLPENGLSVIVTGSISVYERDGAYQLYARTITPIGNGDLQLAFNQLKTKLESEGLFDYSRKKEIPKFPNKIIVITSPVGAAVQDIIRILSVRWPLSKVLVIPVRVQGTEAPNEICNAIKYANENKLGDLIITGRGGGSIEDLWAFNEECVARAIYDSEIPIISAVGHEPDIAISDYVADRRASTPSNAAEIAVPDISDIKKMFESYRSLINPLTVIENRKLDFDNLKDKLMYSINNKLIQNRNELRVLSQSLNALNPQNVLKRGYSIAEKDGKVISSVNDVNSDDFISLLLSDGRINCSVR